MREASRPFSMMGLHRISSALSAAALTVFIQCALTACNKPRQITPACPSGSILRGAAPPKGQEVWCQKMIGGRAVKNGIFIVYNDNGGKMIEGNYRDGVQEGTWTMWYENGQRSAIDHYRNGLQDGMHISWYANGQEALEGNYRAGKREGVWTRWDPSGLTHKQEVYRDGKLIK